MIYNRFTYIVIVLLGLSSISCKEIQKDKNTEVSSKNIRSEKNDISLKKNSSRYIKFDYKSISFNNPLKMKVFEDTEQTEIKTIKLSRNIEATSYTTNYDNHDISYQTYLWKIDEEKLINKSPLDNNITINNYKFYFKDLLNIDYFWTVYHKKTFTLDYQGKSFIIFLWESTIPTLGRYTWTIFDITNKNKIWGKGFFSYDSSIKCFNDFNQDDKVDFLQRFISDTAWVYTFNNHKVKKLEKYLITTHTKENKYLESRTMNSPRLKEIIDVSSTTNWFSDLNLALPRSSKILS